MWNIVNFLAGGITSLFSKVIKKEKIKKAKEQLDTLQIAGLDGIAVPDTSGTFFQVPNPSRPENWKWLGTG